MADIKPGKQKVAVEEYKPFRDSLNTLLEQSGMTNKALADAIGVQPSSITYYRQGAQIPDCIRLAKIADVLHTTTDFLLGRTALPGFSIDAMATMQLTGFSSETMERLINMWHTVSDDQEEQYPIHPIDVFLQSPEFSEIFRILLKFAHPKGASLEDSYYNHEDTAYYSYKASLLFSHFLDRLQQQTVQAAAQQINETDTTDNQIPNTTQKEG